MGAYDSSTGKISKTGTIFLSDVQDALGAARGKTLGELAADKDGSTTVKRVNPLARFKFFRNSTREFTDDATRNAARAAARYGMPASPPLLGYGSGSVGHAVYTADLPRGVANNEPARIGDMRGYYRNAKPQLSMVQWPDKIIWNQVNAFPFCFYRLGSANDPDELTPVELTGNASDSYVGILFFVEGSVGSGSYSPSFFIGTGRKLSSFTGSEVFAPLISGTDTIPGVSPNDFIYVPQLGYNSGNMNKKFVAQLCLSSGMSEKRLYDSDHGTFSPGACYSLEFALNCERKTDIVLGTSADFNQVSGSITTLSEKSASQYDSTWECILLNNIVATIAATSSWVSNSVYAELSFYSPTGVVLKKVGGAWDWDHMMDYNPTVLKNQHTLNSGATITSTFDVSDYCVMVPRTAGSGNATGIFTLKIYAGADPASKKLLDEKTLTFTW